MLSQKVTIYLFGNMMIYNTTKSTLKCNHLFSEIIDIIIYII